MVVSIPSPRAPPSARPAVSADGRAVRAAAWPRRDRCRPAPFYRPRRPRDSPLFQLLERHFAEFERVYAERFAATYGHWRPIVAGTVAKFLRCGDLHEGFARVKCRACKHEFFVAFSCKQRCVCPSCHQKRSLILSERLAAEVCAPVAHRQFVFTVPKRLRVFFRFDRALLGDMARLAWETVLEVYRATLGRLPAATAAAQAGDDLLPGALAGIQTFGELIHWHPHIHALVTDGAFDAAGTFHPLPAIAAEPFRELFAQKILGLLLERGKIGAEVVENIRSWKHSGFSADKSVRIEAGDRAGLERLLRYIVRCPFSMERVVKLGPGDSVIYRAEHDDPRRFPMPEGGASVPLANPHSDRNQDGCATASQSAVAAAAEQALRGGPARNFQVFEPLQFIAEVTQHIPEAGQHLIHYYGWYSNKSRGLRKRAATECGRGLSAATASADPSSPQPAPPPPPRWRKNSRAPPPAAAGPRSSSASMKWTRCVARSAAARCASLPSSSAASGT